ncbi:MAG: glucosamine-6-phosphate deaminase [Chitinophagales bacterium]|nr:glucosamine-6-phosphate deaminase [Chitinophagales bacterium]
MQVLSFSDYHNLSDFAASQIAFAIKNNPSLTLCMASGHTPSLTCDLLVKKLKEENIDYSSLHFLGLDEWAGLPPANEGSCHYFFQTKLFGPLQLDASQYFLFDAMADDLVNECNKMDEHIKKIGGIDMMLVGIGMNGHIGFNEPGTPFNSFCHVARLDETTKTVGQKYFTEKMELTKGITIGLRHLLAAKKALLQANGIKKATVIQQAVEGLVTETFPASIMQQHTNGFILVDEEAGSFLNKTH